MNEETTITAVYCARHPNQETTLRCNRCDTPICSKCAVRTPTGYRCPDCVRGQQKIFETARWYDYPVAFVLTAVLSYLGSQLVSYTGFFTLFIAPIAGVVIAEVVRVVIRRRRSKRLFQVIALGAALGALPILLLYVLGSLGSLVGGGMGGLSGLFPLLWQGFYAFTVTSTVYYRLGGIRIG